MLMIVLLSNLLAQCKPQSRLSEHADVGVFFFCDLSLNWKEKLKLKSFSNNNEHDILKDILDTQYKVKLVK